MKSVGQPLSSATPNRMRKNKKEWESRRSRSTLWMAFDMEGARSADRSWYIDPRRS